MKRIAFTLITVMLSAALLLGVWLFWALHKGQGLKAELESEIQHVQSQLAACGTPIQLRVAGVEVALRSFWPTLTVAGMNVTLPQGNGESLNFLFSNFTVAPTVAELDLGGGFGRFVGGSLPGAVKGAKAKAWEIEAPSGVMMSGLENNYDLMLMNPIRALVLAEGESGSQKDMRPVRLQLPAAANLILRTGNIRHAEEVRTYHYTLPNIASGWLAHPLCSTSELTQLQQFLLHPPQSD